MGLKMKRKREGGMKVLEEIIPERRNLHLEIEMDIQFQEAQRGSNTMEV